MHSLKPTYFPYHPTVSLNHRSVNCYRQKTLAEFERATPNVIDYANSFQLDNAECRSVTLQTAQDIVRLAIFEHFLIAQMTWKRSRQPELHNNRVHIGNLPPMDMYLSKFATCFPMITKPSIVELDLDDVNDDTLAINFVVCKPVDYHQLFAFPPDNGNALVYMDIYSNLATIATNGINFSINFLPHFEYVLYRVVQLIAPNNPTGILPMNYPPTNVVIFQGSPLHTNSYMPSLLTKAADPTPRAGIFTINTNHDHLPIIINSNGEPCNRFTVQALFRTQHPRPILAHHIGNPDWIPRTAADLRRNFDTDMYHVARDPQRIPFSLAIRLIPVYTTDPTEQSICQGWALPHLNDTLCDPELQLFNNPLSYCHTEKENHLEYPFIDQMDPDSPILALDFGESNPYCLHYPGCYAAYLPNSICDSLSCPTQIELVESNNIIPFQQDYTAFSGPHFACLAVSTRRSSLTSPAIRTLDPHRENPAQNDPQTAIFTYDESDTDLPTQNDTTDKNPTQNDEISTETCTEQQISDSETTCADYTQQTQLLPGTQANLAISPPNSPETGSSHTETPSNSPPTAKFASGPLQRFSEAVSNILTPKTAKLPQIPASTDLNSQPTTSTHFSAMTKILPKKNLPSRNSNPHPPNL
jgi:hypothetical protein